MLYVLFGVLAITLLYKYGKHIVFPPFRDAQPQSPQPDTDIQERSRKFRAEIAAHSHYYKLLDDREREVFLRRAWVFFHEKRFEARGIEVTFRMRAIIASYAAQVTFGLPDIRLAHFRTIIVYPQPYKSTITQQFHKGEANPNGAVIFSWEDLSEGHNTPSDGLNLALHEFAHALRLENVTVDAEVDFLDRNALRRFNALAESELSRMRSFTNPHFLRPYAAENQQEFFAVCVENFFERPQLFSAELPELYKALKGVLLQDPLVRPVRITRS